MFAPPPGPLIIPLDGLVLSHGDRRRLRHPAVGGVILFKRNYLDKAQLARLIGEVKAVSPDAPVSVDHEGGGVQRFVRGFTRIPPMARLGAIYERDTGRALHLAGVCGAVAAGELRDAGVDINYAPVLDLGVNKAVIGDRAFHANPEVVGALARAFIDGVHARGMPAVGKHFPGHGSVEGDTHTDLVRDRRTHAEVKARDARVFQSLVDDGALDAVMTAHVVYGDDDEAATCSRAWLDGVLRAEMGFAGPVFSDDLTMRALAGDGDIATVATRALDAGCDLLPVCDFKALDALLDAWSSDKARLYTKRMKERMHERWSWLARRMAERPTCELPGACADALRELDEWAG